MLLTMCYELNFVSDFSFKHSRCKAASQCGVLLNAKDAL
uniref:Uncharacterized protein n=1 Tax=Arundo donax TaxID=35708 RepID=A0A0A9HAY3_ARUDO